MKNLKRPKCPTEFRLGFARELVRYLGGDPSLIDDYDCWWSLAHKYPKLIKPALRYFETVTEGDPSEAAYSLAFYGVISVQRAMRIIERAKTGYPAEAAFYMVQGCGAPVKWAMGVIELAKTGDPAWPARELCWVYGAPYKWAKKVWARWRGDEPLPQVRIYRIIWLDGEGKESKNEPR